MTEHTTFKWKYLIGWGIIGVVVGIIIASSSSLSTLYGSGFSAILGSLGWFFGAGFFGFVIEGIFRYKGRFKQMEKPAWLWYLYPLLIAIILIITCIGVFMGFEKTSHKSTFF